jgi:phosphatidylglycerophosphate synthase
MSFSLQHDGLPELFRSAAIAVMTGLLLVAAMASIGCRTFDLSVGFIMQSVAAFVGIAITLGLWLPQHLPWRRFGAANTITLLRGSLVALLSGFVGRSNEISTVDWVIIWTAIVVLLLDGADGWLARRSGMESRFGTRFDMEVDALFILALALLVLQSGRVGAWVVLSGILRYLFRIAGWLWPKLRNPLLPNKRRQTVGVIQMIALIVCLFPSVDPAAANLVAALALGLLTASFGADTIWLLCHFSTRGDRR